MFTPGFLKKLRKKAIRNRVWFETLDSMERGIYYLVCKVVDRVESPVLGKVMIEIIVKVRNVLKSEFTRLKESIGIKRAWEAAACAVKWGYRYAEAWRNDEAFIRFFAIMELNSSFI